MTQDNNLDKEDYMVNLFNKNIKCPVCESHFSAPSVKAKTYRIDSKDSDFFIRYRISNPYFYEVLLCPVCGYAALRTDVDKIKKYQIKLIQERICSKWIPRNFALPFDEKTAIERFKLALLNTILMEGPSSTKAIITLRIAWMYRLLNDVKNEKTFLSQALKAFNDTYTNEYLPVYGLDRFSIMYLIGELNRLLGDNETALKCYSNSLTSIGSPDKIKQLARNGKDKIKGEL